MTGVILAMALISSLILYGWAIQRYFAREGRVPAPMRGLALTGLVAGVSQCCVLLRSPPSAVGALAGGLLMLAGVCLFLWVLTSIPRGDLPIAFGTGRVDRVATTGPFGLFRHPCYLSYSLTWLGACAARPHVLTILPAAVMIVWYVCIARAEERRLLASSHGPGYAAYCRAVTWFGPSPFAHRSTQRGVDPSPRILDTE